MKKIWIITALISGMTLLGFWSAKKACVMMCPSVLNSTPGRYTDLKLTSHQSEMFQRLDSDYQKDSDALCMKLCQERAELLEIVGKEGADPAIVDNKVTQIGRIQTALEKAAAVHILESSKVLNSAQCKTYLSALKKQLGQCVQKSK